MSYMHILCIYQNINNILCNIHIYYVYIYIIYAHTNIFPIHAYIVIQMQKQSDECLIKHKDFPFWAFHDILGMPNTI